MCLLPLLFYFTCACWWRAMNVTVKAKWYKLAPVDSKSRKHFIWDVYNAYLKQCHVFAIILLALLWITAVDERTALLWISISWKWPRVLHITARPNNKPRCIWDHHIHKKSIRIQVWISTKDGMLGNAYIHLGFKIRTETKRSSLVFLFSYFFICSWTSWAVRAVLGYLVKVHKELWMKQKSLGTLRTCGIKWLLTCAFEELEMSYASANCPCTVSKPLGRRICSSTICRTGWQANPGDRDFSTHSHHTRGTITRLLQSQPQLHNHF